MNQLTPQQLQAAKQAGFTDQELEMYLPQLGFQAPKTWGGFGRNLTRSTGNLIGNTVEGIANIVNPNMEQNTVAQLGRLALGIVDSVLPGEQGNEQYAQALGQYFADRYGGLDKIMETFYSDPAGFIDDAAMVITAGGAAATKVGKLGGLNKVASVGQDVARIGNTIEPITLAGKGMGMVGNRITGAIGKDKIGSRLIEAGQDYSKRGYGQPVTMAKFEKKFRPASEVISEYGLYGKNTDKLINKIDEIQTMFDDIAIRSGRTISSNDLLELISAKIDELRSSGFTEDVTVAKQIEDKVMSLIEAGKITDNNPVDILTELRRGFDERNKSWAIDPALKNSNQTMRDILQGSIRQATSDIKAPTGENLQQLGGRLNELYSFQPIMEQAAMRGTTSRPFSLGKMASAGVGGVVAGLPGAVGMYAIDQFSKSPAADRIISSGLAKTGSVIKNSQMPQVKVPYGKEAYSTGRISRFNQRANTTQNQEPQNQARDESGDKLPQFQPSGDATKSPLSSSAYDPFKKIKTQYKIY